MLQELSITQYVPYSIENRTEPKAVATHVVLHETKSI